MGSLGKAAQTYLTPKHTLSEDNLIALLRSRDRGGIDYLYDNYASTLYGIALQIVKKEAYAEEVLQDAFVSIWEKIDSYDAQKSRLFTWMLNIVRNKSIDKMRSAEVRRENKSDSIMHVVSKVEATGSSVQSSDDIGLCKVLDTLNAEQRFVLDMIYYQGYTHSELSKEFDIPLGTVKTRLRNALIVLRGVLQNE